MGTHVDKVYQGKLVTQTRIYIYIYIYVKKINEFLIYYYPLTFQINVKLCWIVIV